MSQIKAALAGGLSLETVNKVRKLIQDKTEGIQKLGDQVSLCFLVGKEEGRLKQMPVMTIWASG